MFEAFNTFSAWNQVAVISVILSLLFTGVVYFLSRSAPKPGLRDRDVHTAPKPRLGGVAMWLALVTTALIVFGTDPGLFRVGENIDVNRVLTGIGAGLLIVLFTGLLDDTRGLSPLHQLGGHVAAALAVVWAGVQVPYVRIPFWGQLDLTVGAFDMPSFLGGGVLWPLSAVLTLVWVVAVINALNLFDGLDGLAASVATTAGIVLFLVSMRLGYQGASTLSLLTAGVALGFLVWNWHPSKLFMGTVGSQLLGFMLAVAALLSGAKLATAILVLGIPVLDAIVVVIRRLRSGAHPFQGDQRHLHHRLLKLGMPVPWVTIVITAISVFFGSLAIIIEGTNAKALLTLALIILMLVVIGVTYILERKSQRGVG